MDEIKTNETLMEKTFKSLIMALSKNFEVDKFQEEELRYLMQEKIDIENLVIKGIVDERSFLSKKCFSVVVGDENDEEKECHLRFKTKYFFSNKITNLEIVAPPHYLNIGVGVSFVMEELPNNLSNFFNQFLRKEHMIKEVSIMINRKKIKHIFKEHMKKFTKEELRLMKMHEKREKKQIEDVLIYQIMDSYMEHMKK